MNKTKERLYYDNALEAALMMGRFNVHMICCGVDGDEDPEKQIDWHKSLDVNFNYDIWDFIDRLGTAYVHPDSYKIFEPKIGDLITDYHGEIFGKKVHTKGNIVSVLERSNLKDFAELSDKGIRIIERDGKAFFMPKKEGDG